MSFRDNDEPQLHDFFSAMRRAADATRRPIDVSRIDLVPGDFQIPEKLMSTIDRADVVLTDFTLAPHNVYFAQFAAS